MAPEEAIIFHLIALGPNVQANRPSMSRYLIKDIPRPSSYMHHAIPPKYHLAQPFSWQMGTDPLS